MKSFYTLFAFATLFVDAYLVLAAVANKMIGGTGSTSLPPFGQEVASEETRLMVLSLATWTAVLAVGCLYKGHAPSAQAASEQRGMAGVVWFVILLLVVWAAYLLP